ncbi:pseudouridine synthase-related [Holotrichia oblita]|uniref:Pseudouridine synthase-related n=1 Tax=Holotrichia oblita TaxID=644536 RepID=A0ACB9SXY3_HOLOL|nr:pseudouridine synthase-related [Holotrichia oblita]
MLVTDARIIWNNLKGIVCVYKPAGMKVSRVRRTIINKVCTELNEMECRPPVKHVYISGNPSEKLSIEVKPNLADDPLVVGRRYSYNDLLCSWSNYLGQFTSGILILGLKGGTSTAKYIRENKSTRAYRIKGMFGLATEDYSKDGRVVEKTTYKHVKQIHLEKLLSYMQAIHQKTMFELCGVDIQSQTAYELATQGLIRPATSKTPLIYGIKCIDFKLPEFTIEIQCINEYEMYLKSLIHDIGMKMNSSAHCISLQCIRHSYFTLDHALLHRQWNLQNILKNMEQCAKIIAEHEHIVFQKNAALQRG